MSFRPSDVTKGGQITAYRVKMFNQVNNWFSFWTLALLMGASLIAFFLFTPPEIISNGLSYWIARSSESFLGIASNNSAKTFSYAIYRGDAKIAEVPLTLSDVLRSEIMQDVGNAFVQRLEMFAGAGATVSMVVYCVLMFGVARIGKKETEDQYISGMTLTDKPKEVNKLLAKNNALSPLKIGPLHLVKNSEIQNFLFHGTIGTGKSTLIRYMLDYIRKRGDRFIIFDPGNTFIKTHFDASRDFILDPHDARCANWDLWHECRTVVDYENFASSLIPIEGSSDPFWVSSSRTICADTAMKMSQTDNPTIELFLHTILSLSLKNLRTFLKNTPSANLVEEKIEKTAISIRSVTTNYVKALRFMQGVNQGQEKFAIREWMQDSQRANSGLFISTQFLKSTRPLISMWLSMATSLLQSMGENRDRRVWFFIDEVPSLQKIPGLRDVLADARKYGGCFVLGAQNMAQLSDTYGKDGSKAILDLLNTRAYGRSPSYEQALEVERELGNQRKSKAREQNSFGLDQVRDGISIGRDETHQPIVDHEDIMRMPDLRFYFRLPGEYPVIKMDVPYRSLPAKAEGYIERRFTDTLSPLLEKIIAHNETQTPADFAGADTEKAAANAPSTSAAPQAVREEQKRQQNTANESGAQSTESQPASEIKAVPAPTESVQNNVTDIFTRRRPSVAQVAQEQPQPAPATSPAPVAPEQPQPTPATSPAPVAPEQPQAAPEISPVPVAPEQPQSAPPSVAGNRPLKLRLKKLGNDSESESETQEQAHSPVIIQDDSKIIVLDESEIGADGSVVKQMAEEEKNILVHRQIQPDDHEEPSL